MDKISFRGVTIYGLKCQFSRKHHEILTETGKFDQYLGKKSVETDSE